MISAFGIEHGSISKADENPTDKVDDILTPVLPGSTVRAYDNSRRNKRKAAVENFATKAVGAGAGLAVGTLIGVKTKGKVKFLNTPSVLRGRTITPHMKHGYYTNLTGTAAGGVGGGAAGNLSLHSIKRDPDYKYKER